VSAETRRRLGEAALVLALLAAGALVYGLAGDGELALAVGSALMGIAGVVAVSAVFYEVGRGEDQERAAAERRRRAPDAARERRPPGARDRRRPE
jgi:hypothetical protein